MTLLMGQGGKTHVNFIFAVPPFYYVFFYNISAAPHQIIPQ